MMKGLLIKDFKLMKGRRSFFGLIVAMSVGMAAFLEEPSFIIGYMTFVGVLAAMSTISYDEFDNGNAFLFSMPITRKGYAVEKYGFGLVFGLFFWLLAAVIAMIAGSLRAITSISDMLMTAFLFLPILLLTLSVTTPFQLKFGSEKGRLAMIGAAAMIVSICFVAVKAAGLFHIDLISALNRLSSMNMGMLIMMLLGIGIIVLLLSLSISISIMNKKEF